MIHFPISAMLNVSMPGLGKNREFQYGVIVTLENGPTRTPFLGLALIMEVSFNIPYVQIANNRYSFH